MLKLCNERKIFGGGKMSSLKVYSNLKKIFIILLSACSGGHMSYKVYDFVAKSTTH